MTTRWPYNFNLYFFDVEHFSICWFLWYFLHEWYPVQFTHHLTELFWAPIEGRPGHVQRGLKQSQTPLPTQRRASGQLNSREKDHSWGRRLLGSTWQGTRRDLVSYPPSPWFLPTCRSDEQTRWPHEDNSIARLTVCPDLAGGSRRSSGTRSSFECWGPG